MITWQELGATLEAANAANDQPYEDSVLTAFAMPSVDTLAFHPVATLRSAAAARDDAPLTPPPALRAAAAEVAALPLAVQVRGVLHPRTSKTESEAVCGGCVRVCAGGRRLCVCVWVCGCVGV